MSLLALALNSYSIPHIRTEDLTESGIPEYTLTINLSEEYSSEFDDGYDGYEIKLAEQICRKIIAACNYFDSVPLKEILKKQDFHQQEKNESSTTPSAQEFLTAGINHLQARASTYDAPAGERSMAKTVAMFNTYAGTEITEEQGWHFMEILKIVRASQGEFKADNYEDGAAYAALAGESAARDRGKT